MVACRILVERHEKAARCCSCLLFCFCVCSRNALARHTCNCSLRSGQQRPLAARVDPLPCAKLFQNAQPVPNPKDFRLELWISCESGSWRSRHSCGASLLQRRLRLQFFVCEWPARCVLQQQPRYLRLSRTAALGHGVRCSYQR